MSEHVGTLTDPSLWMNTGRINRQHFRNVKENNSKKENYYCTLQTPFWREKHCCVGGELCPLHRLHILLFDKHTSFSDFEQKNSVNALKKKNRVLTCIYVSKNISQSRWAGKNKAEEINATFSQNMINTGHTRWAGVWWVLSKAVLK